MSSERNMPAAAAHDTDTFSSAASYLPDYMMLLVEQQEQQQQQQQQQEPQQDLGSKVSAADRNQLARRSGQQPMKLKKKLSLNSNQNNTYQHQRHQKPAYLSSSYSYRCPLDERDLEELARADLLDFELDDHDDHYCCDQLQFTNQLWLHHHDDRDRDTTDQEDNDQSMWFCADRLTALEDEQPSADEQQTESSIRRTKAEAYLTKMTPTQQQHYLTIEDIRAARNSCWLCGCNWQQDHVSLDCRECGGYAMQRPCPNCDGKCKQVWKRNIAATHDHHEALWVGQCGATSETLQSASEQAACSKPAAHSLASSATSSDCEESDCSTSASSSECTRIQPQPPHLRASVDTPTAPTATTQASNRRLPPPASPKAHLCDL